MTILRRTSRPPPGVRVDELGDGVVEVHLPVDEKDATPERADVGGPVVLEPSHGGHDTTQPARSLSAVLDVSDGVTALIGCQQTPPLD